MRVWWAAGGTALLMASAAPAQQPASSFFTGIPAAQIKNVPLDTSRALIQHPAQAARTGNRFNFTALFNKLTIPGYPPKRGVSPLPPPSAFPTYPNFKLVGTPPYPMTYMFGRSNPSPIYPVPPVIPNQQAPVGPGS
jgi:hypothetical protein